jgi:anthranilate phosphoribosyltransferase
LRRAVSSNCGAVDVAEALGADVESAPALPKQSVEQAGICVLNAFLPALHPRMLLRVLPRIRFGTTINLVGPLLSPTMPSYKVMGVPTIGAVDLEARILRELGFKRAFVMHGLNAEGDLGMDEVSTLGPTHIAELRPDGGIDHSVLTLEALALRPARYQDVASSRDVQHEALTLLRVIANADDGPRQDIVCVTPRRCFTSWGGPRICARARIWRARRSATGGPCKSCATGSPHRTPRPPPG